MQNIIVWHLFVVQIRSRHLGYKNINKIKYMSLVSLTFYWGRQENKQISDKHKRNVRKCQMHEVDDGSQKRILWEGDSWTDKKWWEKNIHRTHLTKDFNQTIRSFNQTIRSFNQTIRSPLSEGRCRGKGETRALQGEEEKNATVWKEEMQKEGRGIKESNSSRLVGLRVLLQGLLTAKKQLFYKRRKGNKIKILKV